MIKKNRGKQLNGLVDQVRFLLNTCLTFMKIVVKSGASRHEYQKKEIHTTKKTMNSTADGIQSKISPTLMVISHAVTLQSSVCA